MKGLDTNVLVRYLAQDDPIQSAQATRYIETHCTNDNPCFISQIVLCELAWVLESNYNQSRDDIASMVENILQVSQLEVMESCLLYTSIPKPSEPVMKGCAFLSLSSKTPIT